MDMTFDQWWFHGHLDYPPHAEDVFELPAGTNVTTEIGCNKVSVSTFVLLQVSHRHLLNRAQHPTSPLPKAATSVLVTMFAQEVTFLNTTQPELMT